jgi:undecaprenyl-diphosphatase
MIDKKAIAPPATRQRRELAFLIYVLVASGIFVTIAILAHTVGSFAVDLTFTRAVQGIHSPAFDALMHAVSWIGFPPQVNIIGAAVIFLLFVMGLRWEALGAAFATLGIGLGLLVKLIVHRPRPGADVVHVFSQIPESGFPSGHVLMCTVFIGYLAFLGYTLLKPSWLRNTVLFVFAVLAMLMGLSRIYLGHHWFSDVMGAYLLGSLWLALTIRFYDWGKRRYFVRHHAAP